MPPRVRPWPSLAVAALGILLSLLLWRLLASAEENRLLMSLLADANVARAHVPDSLDVPTKALDQLARIDLPDDAWLAEAAAMQKAHPVLTTIARLDPAGRPRTISPPGAPLPPVDVAGPPVTFSDGRFHALRPAAGGWLAADFNFRDTLGADLDGRAPGLGILVTDNAVELYRRGDDPPSSLASWKRRSTSDIHGVARTLTIWPRSETLASLRSPLPHIVLAAGLLVSLLLAAVLHLWRLSRALNTGLELRIAAATASLRDAEARARDLYENAPDGFATIDGKTGRLNQCNATLAAITGFPKGELLGKSAVDFVAAQSLDGARAAFNAFQSDGTARDVALRLRRKDGGEVVVSLNISADRDGNLNASFRDMTHLRELEEQLRHAQKMEAVGRLAGGIAHDFNNLLTVILGFADQAGENAPPEIVAAVAEIKRAGERAADLTSKLLTFSRRRVLHPRSIDLNASVRGLEAVLRRLVGERIETITVLDPALGPTLADEGQVEQIVLNLAVNARDAMPNGGRLYVETQNVTLDPETGLRHEGELVQPGPYVLIAVSDTGTGMTPDVLARAFEPFFTTKEFGKGTGLGLATVYATVKQFHGYLWIYSEVGRGTTVKIYLPRLKRTHPEEQAVAPPASVEVGRETILVAEDEDALRRLTANMLRRAGYTVLEAPNGEEALAVAERHPGTLDLLLTDAVMPGILGPDLARHLKRSKPALAVVLMSGYTGTVAADHGMLEREGVFLQKPFSKQVLLGAVREALRKVKSR